MCQCPELQWQRSATASCRKLYTPDSANGGRKQNFKRSRRDASNWRSNDTKLLDSHIADKQPIWMTLLFCHNLTAISEITETKQCEFRLITIFFFLRILISLFVFEASLMCKVVDYSAQNWFRLCEGLVNVLEFFSLSLEQRNNVAVNPLHLQIVERGCLSNNTFSKTIFYYTTHFQTVFTRL